jgi:hypothetical protein
MSAASKHSANAAANPSERVAKSLNIGRPPSVRSSSEVGDRGGGFLRRFLMNRPRIVISVNGGYVRDVHCSVENAEVVLVDWDVEPGDFSPEVVDVIRNRRSRNALVECFDALPFRDLSGTYEAAAIFQSACVRAEAPGSASSSTNRHASTSH